MRQGIIKIIFAVMVMGSVQAVSISAKAQDTTRVTADTSKNVYSADDVVIGEIELTEITIEAEIEKPRVSIMPKRMDPELGEMEFIDRSFENELKKGPETPFLIDERVKTPAKIKEKKN